MFTDGAYVDRYDLHRPTVVKSAAHEETVSVPGEATSADNPCLFFPKPGQMEAGMTGLTMDYDAILLAPVDADLKPEDEDEQPDYVKVYDKDGVEQGIFLVVSVANAAGRGIFTRCLLRKRK